MRCVVWSSPASASEHIPSGLKMGGYLPTAKESLLGMNERNIYIYTYIYNASTSPARKLHKNGSAKLRSILTTSHKSHIATAECRTKVDPEIHEIHFALQKSTGKSGLTQTTRYGLLQLVSDSPTKCFGMRFLRRRLLKSR